jgi:hypothetical protein
VLELRQQHRLRLTTCRATGFERPGDKEIVGPNDTNLSDGDRGLVGIALDATSATNLLHGPAGLIRRFGQPARLAKVWLGRPK